MTGNLQKSFADKEGVLERLNRATQLSARQNPSSDFDLNKDTARAGTTYRTAAVLVPIIVRDTQPFVILTKRAAHLNHHPGQIAFPGGKLDDNDATPQAAALREAQEEIGLSPKNVDVIGTLPHHNTVTGFEVHPFIGHVKSPFPIHIDPNEVSEVFEVPLSYVLDQRNFQIQSRYWMGKKRSYYVVPYGPFYIWGATARMLRMLADLMDQTDAH